MKAATEKSRADVAASRMLMTNDSSYSQESSSYAEFKSLSSMTPENEPQGALTPEFDSMHHRWTKRPADAAADAATLTDRPRRLGQPDSALDSAMGGRGAQAAGPSLRVRDSRLTRSTRKLSLDRFGWKSAMKEAASKKPQEQPDAPPAADTERRSAKAGANLRASAGTKFSMARMSLRSIGDFSGAQAFESDTEIPWFSADDLGLDALDANKVSEVKRAVCARTGSDPDSDVWNGAENMTITKSTSNERDSRGEVASTEDDTLESFSITGTSVLVEKEDSGSSLERTVKDRLAPRSPAYHTVKARPAEKASHAMRNRSSLRGNLRALVTTNNGAATSDLSVSDETEFAAGRRNGFLRRVFGRKNRAAAAARADGPTVAPVAPPHSVKVNGHSPTLRPKAEAAAGGADAPRAPKSRITSLLGKSNGLSAHSPGGRTTASNGSESSDSEYESASGKESPVFSRKSSGVAAGARSPSRRGRAPHELTPPNGAVSSPSSPPPPHSVPFKEMDMSLIDTRNPPLSLKVSPQSAKAFLKRSFKELSRGGAPSIKLTSSAAVVSPPRRERRGPPSRGAPAASGGEEVLFANAYAQLQRSPQRSGGGGEAAFAQPERPRKRLSDASDSSDASSIEVIDLQVREDDLTIPALEHVLC